MHKRFICVAVCALAAIAPSVAQASGVSYDNEACIGHAQWQMTIDFLGQSYADVTITDGSCTDYHLLVDPLNATVDAHPYGATQQPYTHRLQLSSPLGNATAYTTVGTDATGTALVTVVGNQLTAEGIGLPSGPPHLGPTSVTWLPAGSCGTNCFLTTAVGVDRELTAG